MYIAVAVGALLIAKGVGLAPVGVILLSLACGFFFTVILTPFHELAHALTARVLKLPVYSVVVGWFGKPLLKFRFGRCSVIVTRIPLGGMTILAHPSPRYIRIRELLVVASAPLLHLLFILLAWRIIESNQGREWMPGWLAWLVIVFGLANVFELVLNLWPRTVLWGALKLQSDGLALMRFPFAAQAELDRYHLAYFYYECMARLEEGDHSGAMACCLSGLERFPKDPALTSCQALVHLDRGDTREALRVFEELRRYPDITAEYDAMLLSNIAWTHLVSEDEHSLRRASDYSRQAIEALPWLPEVKGTRGSVLVAVGEIETGIALLRQALVEDDDADHSAAYAAFLAIGCARLGNLTEARDFLRQAEREPRCRLIDRARRELDGPGARDVPNSLG